MNPSRSPCIAGVGETRYPPLGRKHGCERARARFTSNLVGVDPAAVRIGMDVGVSWDVAPGLAIPRFRA